MTEFSPAHDGLGAAEEPTPPAELRGFLEAYSPITDEDVTDASLATLEETLAAPAGAVPLRVAAGGAEQAIAWYRAHLGSTAYEGWCEKAARTAWGCAPKYPSAIAHWNRGGPKHTTNTPPRGAFVFWNISRFGHIGIADGAGGFYATGVHGRIGHATSVHYYRHYLGWIPGGCA
ncbi:CHAP domain-containing protein [Streptomyces sp. NPDC048281]|uniref:CHAP domain-containing protein n=1 Tax=Streptomyces sp. NPDC048281 TaxID=3154715 RepID=UPI0034126F66